ncbi:hypothetical protein HDU92_007796 [Lobulomyces angularis]|nr:hypothetical protein HDU92_007796 [Lobulomyces angularis]
MYNITKKTLNVNKKLSFSIFKFTQNQCFASKPKKSSESSEDSSDGKKKSDVSFRDLLETDSVEKLEADQWLKSPEGGLKYALNTLKLSENERRDRYLRFNTPFPSNPFYKPIPPLSNETRNKIYELYVENPVVYTTRKLGELFGISIIRVSAILRLKALEAEYAEKEITIQNRFSEHMDNLLLAETVNVDAKRSNATKRENLRPVIEDNLNPFFKLIEEEDNFTPDDAAHLLRKEPFANVEIRLDKQADKVFNLKPPVEDTSKTTEEKKSEQLDSKKKVESAEVSGEVAGSALQKENFKIIKKSYTKSQHQFLVVDSSSKDVSDK